MSKDIWHTRKEIPDEDQYIVVKNNMGLYTVSSEFEYDLDRVEKWAYFDDFLALETELERTRKALDVAKKWLMKIGYLNMSEHGLGSEKMMTDWCKTVALHGLKEIETALEQKEQQ
jgi:hypothetical protein